MRAEQGQDDADAVALKALGFLAERPDTLGRFLDMSGLDVDGLRAAAGAPETLAAVMDFVMSDESLAAEFCVNHGLSPEAFAAARAALPGGDAPFWL